jgi:hypothetical protein
VMTIISEMAFMAIRISWCSRIINEGVGPVFIAFLG